MSLSYLPLWPCLRGVESIIALGLMVVMAGPLAFGAVEPWSLATLGLSVIALLVLWVIKGLQTGVWRSARPRRDCLWPL